MKFKRNRKGRFPVKYGRGFGRETRMVGGPDARRAAGAGLYSRSRCRRVKEEEAEGVTYDYLPLI